MTLLPTLPHSISAFSSLKVVKRICEAPHRTRLLVVDRETDEYLRSQGLACTEDQAIEMGNLSPRPSPKPTPSASPIPRENSPLTLRSNLRYFFHFPAVDSPTTKDTRNRASMASSSTTDTEVRTDIEKFDSIKDGGERKWM